MQCRDTKCTPNKVMEKERVTYMHQKTYGFPNLSLLQ